MPLGADVAPLPLMRKSDQVFQLSLTELAFIIIFILLILFGWLVQHEQRRSAKLEKELKASHELSATAAAWSDVRSEVTSMLGGAGMSSKDIDKRLSDLVERKTALLENQRLRQQIAELDAQLTALASIKFEVQKSANKANAANTMVIESLALKAALERGLGKPINADEAPKLVAQIAAAIKLAQDNVVNGFDVKELMRTNDRMKHLVAHYERKLNMRGGIDFPPCWLDANTGKAEFLFNVDLIPSGVLLTPSWPPHREAEARALPGVEALLNFKGLSLAEFNTLMQGIDQRSRAANCRHYVVLDNHVGDLATFNRLRFGVENFFYKYEKRKGGQVAQPGVN